MFQSQKRERVKRAFRVVHTFIHKCRPTKKIFSHSERRRYKRKTTHFVRWNKLFFTISLEKFENKMKIIDKENFIGKWGYDCKFYIKIKIEKFLFAKISYFSIPELIVQSLPRVSYIIIKNIYVSLSPSLWCSLRYTSKFLIFEKIFLTKSAGIIFVLCKKWDSFILLLLTNLKYVSYHGREICGIGTNLLWILKIINSSLII